MARYFFHLHERDSITLDEIGLERISSEAARQEAIRAARDVMIGELALGRLALSPRIEVTDEHGESVLTLPFNEAIAEWDTRPTH